MSLLNPVSAPSVHTPKGNLVSSGHLVDISTDKWENGVTFTPRGCYQIDGTCAVCGPMSKEEMQECQEAAEFIPYILDLGISLYAPDREEVSAFAEDDLEAGTSSRLESLIWSGCPGDDNPLLSQGTSLGSSATPVIALGRMISELISATGHGGASGTIHMSPLIAVQLSEYLYCEHETGDVYTKIGYHHVIVGNYPATSIVGHVGEVDVYLGDPFKTAGKERHMRKNLTEFRWERMGLATWNPCAVFRQTIT
jgi:hypothetical protein